MEKLEKYIQFVLRWEGKYGKSKEDSASSYYCPTPLKGVNYHTSHGITYTTWVRAFGTSKDAEFYSMPHSMWMQVFKPRFWDKIKGDQLPFGIAVIVTDIAWMSGPGVGAKSLQKGLNRCGAQLTVDGAIGPKTIEAVKATDQGRLFDKIVQVRAEFYDAIDDGKNAKFAKGWANRLEAVKEFRLM